MGISANQARLLTLTARQHDLELRAQRISAHKMILSLNSQQWAKKYSEALNNYSISKQYAGITFDQAFTNVSKSYPNRLYMGVGNVSATAANLDGYELVTSLTEGDYITALANGKNLFGVRVESSSKTLTNKEVAYSTAIYALLKEKQTAAVANYQDKNWFNWTYDAVAPVDLGNGTYTLIIENIKDANTDPRYIGRQVRLDELADDTKARILGNSSGEISPVFTQAEIDAKVSALGLAINDDPNAEGKQVETQTYYLTKIELHYSSDNAKDDDLSVIKGEYDSAMAALSSEEKILDMELTQINTEHNAVKTEYDAVKSLIKDNTEKSFNVFG